MEISLLLSSLDFSQSGKQYTFALKTYQKRVFPDFPVVRTMHAHCWMHRFHPWLGNWDPTIHVTQSKITTYQRKMYKVNDSPKILLSERMAIHSLESTHIFSSSTRT